MLPCIARKTLRGLYIETLTGDGLRAICTIGNRLDIRHIVKVGNLRLYPLRVECKGSILGNPASVKFSSPVAIDTESEWKSSSVVPSGGEAKFDHVLVFPVFPSSAVIALEVKARWLSSEKTASALLTIQVTV